MKIIDLCFGHLSYRAMVEAYQGGCSDRIHPEWILMSRPIAHELDKKFADQAPVTRFEDARILVSDDIGNNIWFHNSHYPEYDVVLINISLV